MTTQSLPKVTSDSSRDGGLSVLDAASRIEAMLSPEPAGKTQPKAEATKPAKAAPAATPNSEDDNDGYEPDPDTGSDDEADTEVTDDEPVVADEEEGSQQDDDEEIDEEPTAPAPATTKHKLKVDGEDIEVTTEEALAGYSRNASFTRKSQALAEKAKAFETEQNAVRAERQQYATGLADLHGALSSLAQEPNWEALQAENPDAFAATHAAWQIHKGRIAGIERELAAANEKVANDNAQAHATFLRSEHQKLSEYLPEWKDTGEKGDKLRKGLYEYGTTQGYAAHELDGVADSRALKVLHKAMLYDKAQAEAKKTAKKGQVRIAALPTVTPGSKPNKGKTAKTTEQQRRMNRLKKSGSINDAASLIESML